MPRQRIRDALLGAVDFAFGYDFFVSYKHEDGPGYPRSLASRLTAEGFRVFLDQRDYVAGDELKQATKRRVRMSVYLVVVARPGAMARSDWVIREVEVSVSAARTPIVVDVDGAFERAVGRTEDDGRRVARMRELLADRLRVYERSDTPPPRVYDGEASDAVVGELRRAFRATRQDVRRARVFGAAALVFAAISALAVTFGVQSALARAESEREAARARSGELAAQARLVMARTPQLGSLLAARAAAPVLSRIDTEIVPARQALMDAALALTGRGVTHEARVRALALAPDGRWFATSASDDRVRLWEVPPVPEADARLLSTTELAEHPLAISPDGRWLLAGGGETTRLCRVAEAKGLGCARLDPPTLFVHEAVFDPTGRWLVAVGNDDDLWGWDLHGEQPAGTARQIGRGLHSVRYAVFSSDGGWLAAQGLTATESWVWRVADGRVGAPRVVRPHAARVDSIALDGRGSRLAAGYEDGTVVVVPLARGAGVQRLSAPDGDHSIEDLVFSHDGRWLAARMVPFRDDGQRSGTALLWHASAEGRFGPPELLGHGSATRSIAFDPSDRWLYVETVGGPLALWDLRSHAAPRRVTRLTGHGDTVVSFDFDEEGRQLATASVDGGAYAWDLSCADVAKSGVPLLGHEAAVTSIAITRDARWAASLGDDGTVRLWELGLPAAGDPYVMLRDCGSDLAAAALGPDGAQLAAGTEAGEVSLWDLSAVEPARTRRTLSPATPDADPVEGVAFDAAGRRLAAWTDGGRLTVWRAVGASGELRRIDLEGHRGRTAILSVAFGAGEWVASADFKGNAWLWDLGRPDPARDRVALSAPGRKVTDVVASPDGRWVAGQGYDGLWLWDLANLGSGSAPRALEKRDAVVSSVSFSPDGRCLWSVDQDGTARVWSVPFESPSPDRRVAGQDTGPWPFEFSAPGRYLLAQGEADDRPHLWSLAGTPGSWSGVLLGGAASGRAGAVSQDERLVASASDNTVSVWRTSAPDRARSVLRANEAVDEIRFSKDGRLLAFTAASELFVSALVADRAVPALRLRGHKGRIRFLELAAGDRWAVTQSYDAMRLWPMRTPELLRDVQSRSGRELRPEERAAYLQPDVVAPSWLDRLLAFGS